MTTNQIVATFAHLSLLPHQKILRLLGPLYHSSIIEANGPIDDIPYTSLYHSWYYHDQWFITCVESAPCRPFQAVALGTTRTRDALYSGSYTADDAVSMSIMLNQLFKQMDQLRQIDMFRLFRTGS